MLPFAEIPPKNPNWFQRLFHIQVKDNAFIEINNLLATCENIGNVSSSDITAIADKYRTTIEKIGNLQNLYEQYVHNCYLNNFSDETHIDTMRYMKNLFSLNESICTNIESLEAKIAYETEFRNRSVNQSINDEDMDYLDKMRDSIPITTDEATSIHRKVANEYINNYLAPIIQEGAYSPEQEKGLYTLASKMHVEHLSFTDDTTKALARYRLMWNIQYGEIPRIDVNINLYKNEKCYMVVPANLLEHRKVTTRVNYGGPSVRIKIAKGVYWRSGSMGVKRITEDVLAKIDSGHLYVTSHRLIFMGSQKDSTIRLEKILDFHPFTNGIEIEKETGKNQFLEFNHEVGLFSAILARGIHDIGV